MTQFLQLLVYGIVQGTTYALLASSFWLIYATTRTFHLAHSLIYSIAGYGVVVACIVLKLPLYAGAIFALVGAVVTGIAIDVLFYRPLRARGGRVLSVFLVSLGVATAGAALLQLYFGPLVRQIPDVPNKTLSLGNVSITALQLSSTLAGALAILAVWLFLNRSRAGHAITAVRTNRNMAMAVGINTDRVSALVFGIGSAMAAICSFFETISFVAYPTMGLQPVMYGVIGVFLGGIGSIQGAALGGFLLGFLIVFSGLFLSQNLGVILVFAVLLVIVVFRPTGLITAGADI